MEKAIFFFCASVIFFSGLMSMEGGRGPLEQSTIYDQQKEINQLYIFALDLASKGVRDRIAVCDRPLHGRITFLRRQGIVTVFTGSSILFCVLPS